MADAPFAYWITVNRLGPNGRYRRALRYRSRTRYGDDSPKAVIDSDMAETLRRLGLRRSPLVLPFAPSFSPSRTGRR